MRRLGAGLAALAAACLWSAWAAGGERLTGQPLPRHAAIRATEANLRVGPDTTYEIRWQYRRRGLPVRIVREHFDWRQIEDPSGETGWMSAHLLMDWPRAIVTGRDRGRLRRSPSEDAAGLALLEPGVMLTVHERRGGWCRVSVESHAGWLRRDEVWGACSAP